MEVRPFKGGLAVLSFSISRNFFSICQNFWESFISVLIRTLFWAFLADQNFEILLFIFLWAGDPQGIEKNFLSWNQDLYIQSDRARRADYKYHIFIRSRPSNKKNLGAFLAWIPNTTSSLVLTPKVFLNEVSDWLFWFPTLCLNDLSYFKDEYKSYLVVLN